LDTQSIIEGLDELFANKQIYLVEDYLSDHLSKALEEGDTGCAITLMNELIGYYRDSSQYDKMEKYCERLLPFLEKVGLDNTIHYGTSCLNVANGYRACGRYKDSYAHYKKVFQIYENCIEDDDFLYASLHNNLSLLYQEMKSYDLACESLNAALEIVKLYPEAIIELAVTYTNLAASYVKANRFEEAKNASEEALKIFENGHENDYHYAAAVSDAGDIHFDCEEYEEAAKCYEKAMLLLRSHVGLTHAYFRIVSNLDITYRKLGKKDALKGMCLCEEYYNKYGVVISDVSDNVCVGKVGEGSECFELDDIISIDHDFGPGFCIFVTYAEYERTGKLLETTYSNLPKTYKGFQCSDHAIEIRRNGVVIVEEFFQRILNLSREEVAYLMEFQNLSDKVWIRLEDWQLKTVTNGKIFTGEQTVFGRIYRQLKKGYPSRVKRKRIAQLVGKICQEGQYNYSRMMIRNELMSAVYLKQQFVNHCVKLLFMLNNEYAPHDKWLFVTANKRIQSGEWKYGTKCYQLVEQLANMTPSIASYQSRDMIDWIGKPNYDDQVYVLIEEIAKCIADCLKECGYSECNDSYLESHIPFILKQNLEEGR